MTDSQIPNAGGELLFEGLTPDILGEYFVLKMLRELVQSNRFSQKDAAKELLKYAFEAAPVDFSNTAFRIYQDFGTDIFLSLRDDYSQAGPLYRGPIGDFYLLRVFDRISLLRDHVHFDLEQDPLTANDWNGIERLGADQIIFEEILADLERGISFEPEVMALKYHFYINNGRFAACVEELATFGPDSPDWVWFYRGAARIELKAYREAVTDFEYLVTKGKPDSDIPVVHISIAMVHQALGKAWYYLDDNEQAWSNLQVSLELQPENPETHNMIGLVHAEYKRSEEAIQSFDTAIALNPNSHMCRRNKAKELYVLRRYEEAIAELDLAIETFDLDARYFRLRGNAKYELGRYPEAIADYQQAQKLEPDNLDGFYWCGESLSKLRQYQEALHYFEYCLSVNQAHSNALLGTADAYYYLADYTNAL
jgi:tetratricopeptide (TPR) repeat protein